MTANSITKPSTGKRPYQAPTIRFVSADQYVQISQEQFVFREQTEYKSKKLVPAVIPSCTVHSTVS